MILAVPEYNYTPSPVIMNAIDWAMPATWRSKCVAFMSTGGYMGCTRAQL